uniref:Uncharacterized protein n=1 Tax=Glossina austeni TaxID=7395 RepID=A0A1A9VWB1_GLOAU
MRIIASRATSGTVKSQIGCKRDKLGESSASSPDNPPKRPATETVAAPSGTMSITALKAAGIASPYKQVVEMTKLDEKAVIDHREGPSGSVRVVERASPTKGATGEHKVGKIPGAVPRPMALVGNLIQGSVYTGQCSGGLWCDAIPRWESLSGDSLRVPTGTPTVETTASFVKTHKRGKEAIFLLELTNLSNGCDLLKTAVIFAAELTVSIFCVNFNYALRHTRCELHLMDSSLKADKKVGK